MATPDISNLIIYNSNHDISYIEYNKQIIPYGFNTTYIYHSNQYYSDQPALARINNNLIIESVDSNIIMSTAENKRVIVKNNMAVNANLDVSNILTTKLLKVTDICLNNILYLDSSLNANIIGDLKIQGSISQVTTGISEEKKGFTSNNAALTTSSFAYGVINISRIILSNIYSSNITSSYIYNTPIGYTSSNITLPDMAIFTDVSLQSLSLNSGGIIKFSNNTNTNNPTIIQSSEDYSKLDINKPLIVRALQSNTNISNISIFNGDISCNTLYYTRLNPDIRLNNYFDVSIGNISISGNIIPTTNFFNIGSIFNKFNQIHSNNFIGNLIGTCSIADNLKPNLDMSFNNLDISGVIRLGGVSLNETLRTSYLTISGADISFRAIYGKIYEVSSNVYTSQIVDTCLNTTYVTKSFFELSFQDISGKIKDLSRNIYSTQVIDTCLNANFVKISPSNAGQFKIFDDRFIFESSGNYIQKISSPYNSAIICEWRSDFTSLNNPVIRFHASGDITNITNSYSSWSDIRLKENIVDTGPKLADLLKVRVVNYDLKGLASTNKHIGVIAQELETIFPGLVSENEPSQEDIKACKTENYKSVKYSCFTLILIKALQEEQEIINKLDSRILTLNEQYNSIKDLQEETRVMSTTINSLKQENVILKYKLNEILSELGKNIIA